MYIYTPILWNRGEQCVCEHVRISIRDGSGTDTRNTLCIADFTPYNALVTYAYNGRGRMKCRGVEKEWRNAITDRLLFRGK